MNFIVIFASFAAIVAIIRKSFRQAFLDVYVPVLLCLPAWPRWVLPGVPDPTFQQAALLPIAAVACFRARKCYRFSILDLFVAGLVGVIGVSEWINTGFPEAQNLVFDMVASGLVPYLLAKVALQSSESRIRFMRVFVLCVSFVIVTTLYEIKFSFNTYRMLFDNFFPSQGEGWVTTFRYGLTRVAGPYGHAILAGIVFMIALRMQCWLQAAKVWEPKFKYIPIERFTKAQILTAWTFFGLCITWVRGPQIGAALAWVVSYIGRGKNPKKRMALVLSGMVLAGIPLTYMLYAYVSVGRAAAVTVSQESAAYRKELVDLYFVIAMRHPWLGWGRNTWPKLQSMPSIDNHYLLLALMHGLLAVALLVIILGIVCTRLFKTGIKTSGTDRRTSTLSFDLLGIYIGFAFSIGTVYMGENVFPLFFVLLGFTEAFLLASAAKIRPVEVPKRGRVQVIPLKFRRVLA